MIEIGELSRSAGSWGLNFQRLRHGSELRKKILSSCTTSVLRRREYSLAAQITIYLRKLGMNRRQAMEHYLSVISDAFEAGVMPRCHLEDITRADFYGFVVPL